MGALNKLKIANNRGKNRPNPGRESHMKTINSSDWPLVILVDEHDNCLGTQEKLKVHRGSGQLHRAFSTFVIDENDRVLLQRRAKSKYHCPGLWANTCCSHPQPGKSLLECAEQRLQVEFGFSTSLHKIGTVQYNLPLDNDFTEQEFDHIFLGCYNGPVAPNPYEIDAYKWVHSSVLAQDLIDNAERYVPWLPKIFPIFFQHPRM